MRIGISVFVIAMLFLAASAGMTNSSPPDGILRVAPPTVHFGTKQVGTFTLKGAVITNASSRRINLFVAIDSMPDDFSFGLWPGSTCDPFQPAPLEPGDSCKAVVGFRPSDFFAGHEQHAALAAHASDPDTGEVLETVQIEFFGTGN
jgi:hypothetical protein